jgi:hypothetical protein
MRKCANISPYMRRPLYDFASAPSEFPYIRGKFDFLFYQCTVYTLDEKEEEHRETRDQHDML